MFKKTIGNLILSCLKTATVRRDLDVKKLDFFDVSLGDDVTDHISKYNGLVDVVFANWEQCDRLEKINKTYIDGIWLRLTNLERELAALKLASSSKSETVTPVTLKKVRRGSR